MTMARALVLLAALGLSIASTLDPDPGVDPPDPDSCANASTTGATALVIGHSGDPFTPLGDMEEAEIIAGFQGSDMLPVRFRVEGIDADCVSQLTEVSSGGEVIATSNVGLQTYADGPARTTMDHYLILGGFVEPGGEIAVTATVGGATDSVVLVAP